MTHPTPGTLLPARRFGLVRMTGRDRSEQHRVASALELFFDLVFVVAVSQASQTLHHLIVDGHAGSGVLGYVMVFFAVFWAWMNFTWFSSAFDTDDWLYRTMTFLQMGGVLVLAAGVHDAMVEQDFLLVTVGYAIMRLALVGQWIRLAVSDPAQRPVAIRFAAAITVVQVLWIGRLALAPEAGFIAFWVLMLAEILVPLWAERAQHTSWHPHHIAERFGLFTLILLGESLLASATAIFQARSDGVSPSALIGLSIAGIVVAASLWWIYFSRDQADRFVTDRAGFVFGYAHFAVFAAIGAVSAGIEVEVAWLTHHADSVTELAVGLSFALPVAIFLVAAWWVLLWRRVTRFTSAIVLLAAIGTVVSAALPVATVIATASLLAVVVIALEVDRARSLAAATAVAHRRGGDVD